MSFKTTLKVIKAMLYNAFNSTKCVLHQDRVHRSYLPDHHLRQRITSNYFLFMVIIALATLISNICNVLCDSRYSFIVPNT